VVNGRTRLPPSIISHSPTTRADRGAVAPSPLRTLPAAFCRRSTLQMDMVGGRRGQGRRWTTLPRRRRRRCLLETPHNGGLGGRILKNSVVLLTSDNPDRHGGRSARSGTALDHTASSSTSAVAAAASGRRNGPGGRLALLAPPVIAYDAVTMMPPSPTHRRAGNSSPGSYQIQSPHSCSVLEQSNRHVSLRVFGQQFFG